MSFLSNKSAILLATLILLTAAALRLAQIGELPPGLHYDEAADTIIAREIAEGRSAPIFVPAYTGKEVLFFYWATAWMKLIGTTPFTMRLAAATMGVLTVAVTYWAVREMFHPHPSPLSLGGRGAGSERVALLTAAFLATSFWHVLMSRLGFRSIAEPCVQAFALAALWRGLRLNHRGWLIAGGAFVGLNLYTYLAARLFPVAIALLFVYLLVADKEHRRERLIQFGIVVVAASVVFAPLGIYFLQNPTAFLTRIGQVAPRDGQATDLLANIIRALGMFFVTGDPYVRFNLPGRPLFPVVLGAMFNLGVMVAIVGAFRARRPLRRAAYFFALASTLVMLLPTALAVNEITPSNLRAIGMMPVVFIFPALAVWSILKWWMVKRRMTNDARRRIGAFVVRRSSFVNLTLAFILIGAAVDSGRAYFGEYTRLPQLYYESDGDLVDIAERLSHANPADTAIYVHTLHYRHPTLAALSSNYDGMASITGADTIVLPPGPSMHVFAHLALPDRAWLDRVLSGAQIETVPGPDGQTSYIIAHLNAAPSIAPSVSQPANFGNTLELLGYTLESTPRSGGEVDVTLFWRVLNAPDRGDYATFVEVRDAWGYQWGQADSFDYPAEEWTSGEIILQRLRVPIAPGAPPGDYQLDVGWYSAGGDRRLPIVAANGSFGGTVTTLRPISIARATQPPSVESLGMRTQIDAKATKGLTLLGASLETPVAPQGGPLFFTLFWQSEAALQDQQIEVQLLGNKDYSLSTTAPVYGTYPFSEWTPDEVVADRYGLRAPVDAEPGDYALQARVGRGPWIEFGMVRVEAMQRNFVAPPIAHPLDVTFGEQIALIGYDIDRTEMRAGESITLTLVWRALTTPDADYTVFTHLLDPSGAQRGGRDNAPLNGAYNTSLWVEAEVIVDTYVIPLEAGAPPGEYSIEIGMYQFDSGARLPLSIGGDALRLTAIEVAP